MISSKLTTQAWAKTKQRHDYEDSDPQRRFTSATADGANENIGDQLNKIANPTGKDSTGAKVRKAHNTLDKDDFLKLMLTQMKNQDPFNPLQSHEMAAQLAQFTSLEQMFNVNKNLENLTNKQDPMAKFGALSFLGKAIKADTREIYRQAGETANELRFTLGGDATKIKIKIFDETGKTVNELETAGQNKGLAKYVWDGKDARKQETSAGKYTFQVEAFSNTGNKVAVQTETKGVITGINYTPEGPLLMVGDQKVKLSDVQKIEDADLKELQNTKELGVGAQNKTAQPEDTSATINSGMQAYQKAIEKSKPEQRPQLKATDVTSPIGQMTSKPFVGSKG
ncbi:MAG: hypothetical protein IPM57_00215 [Oligoflexia bacterium]|nr:hypothetical protein [Oligoflexia bacterium]